MYSIWKLLGENSQLLSTTPIHWNQLTAIMWTQNGSCSLQRKVVSGIPVVLSSFKNRVWNKLLEFEFQCDFDFLFIKIFNWEDIWKLLESVLKKHMSTGPWFLLNAMTWDFFQNLPNLSLWLRLSLTICASVFSFKKKNFLIKIFIGQLWSKEKLTNLPDISLTWICKIILTKSLTDGRLENRKYNVIHHCQLYSGIFSFVKKKYVM